MEWGGGGAYKFPKVIFGDPLLDDQKFHDAPPDL